MLLFLMFAACTPREECDIDTSAAALAGDGAVQCGAAGAEVDAAGWACAVDAWNAGNTFILRYSQQGIDSVVERSWVYDGSHLWVLSQDQFDNPPWDVDGYECVDPTVVTGDDGGSELDCGSTEPEGNHYQVCGEICEDCGDPDPLPFPE